MSTDTDVLVIGAGPAGTASAIRLALAGWHVTLIEQQRFPRHKVCGECIAAGSWNVLDDLGVGPELRQLAGPDLREVGWMSATRTLVTRMPPCREGRYRYGRALGRDHLDAALLERARAVGVTILQPATLVGVAGSAGHFDCTLEWRSPHVPSTTHLRTQEEVHAALVIDAHGSWERKLVCSGEPEKTPRRPRRLGSELLAFKASFRDTRLPDGFLPVIAFRGGYGGMVKADHDRTTLACCIRRDTLEAVRTRSPGQSAGDSIESHLRNSCHGIAEALHGAQREGPWLSVGPIRPGIRVQAADPLLRVGNAAGETHPLIGEGINMALQSALLLAAEVGTRPARPYDMRQFERIQRAYAATWRHQFASRLQVGRLYAHIAMNPILGSAAEAILMRTPRLLALAARLAGKARPPPMRLLRIGHEHP